MFEIILFLIKFFLHYLHFLALQFWCLLSNWILVWILKRFKCCLFILFRGMIIDIALKLFVLFHEYKWAACYIAITIFNMFSFKINFFKIFDLIVLVTIKIFLHSMKRLPNIIFEFITKNFHKIIMDITLNLNRVLFYNCIIFIFVWGFINIHEIHNTLQI